MSRVTNFVITDDYKKDKKGKTYHEKREIFLIDKDNKRELIQEVFFNPNGNIYKINNILSDIRTVIEYLSNNDKFPKIKTIKERISTGELISVEEVKSIQYGNTIITENENSIVYSIYNDIENTRLLEEVTIFKNNNISKSKSFKYSPENNKPVSELDRVTGSVTNYTYTKAGKTKSIIVDGVSLICDEFYENIGLALTDKRYPFKAKIKECITDLSIYKHIGTMGNSIMMFNDKKDHIVNIHTHENGTITILETIPDYDGISEEKELISIITNDGAVYTSDLFNKQLSYKEVTRKGINLIITETERAEWNYEKNIIENFIRVFDSIIKEDNSIFERRVVYRSKNIDSYLI